jgi:hypothetical protein
MPVWDVTVNGSNIEGMGAFEELTETESVATTDTLDVSLYSTFNKTMTAGTTFTFSNPAASGQASSFTLRLAGAFTPTFPASVDWAGGSAPTYATPTLFTFVTFDGGTTWLGTALTGLA